MPAADNDTLYHYCSTEAFRAILSGRALRLSALSLSNDALEGRLVRETLMTLADGLDSHSRAELEKTIASVERNYHGFGFCLSIEGDLLSQWRGYADDGHGMCIGFSRTFLDSIVIAENASRSGLGEAHGVTTSLEQVIYEPEAQRELLRPIYAAISNRVERGAYGTQSASPKYAGNILSALSLGEQFLEDSAALRMEIGTTVAGLFPKLYTLKTAAFAEEREWRLLSMHPAFSEEPWGYRASRSTLIPFKEMSFGLGSKYPAAITWAIRGPKNTTPLAIISEFCGDSGHSKVMIKASKASYR